MVSWNEMTTISWIWRSPYTYTYYVFMYCISYT